MPTVLHLLFPGRRYHATPWGSHVNEGAVEWPPSPWRLLRALIATGFAKHFWEPSGPPPVARRLLSALASEPPTFALPLASSAHSRHYVTADAKKPLILDAWARVEEGDSALEVAWPFDLDAEERELLATLAASLGYLGRAESWVEAVASTSAQRPANCRSGSTPPGPGWEAVRVLCAVSPTAYEQWRAEAMNALDERLPLPPDKKVSAKLQKERDKAMVPFPVDLIAALCADTGTLKHQGWSAPPGSQEVVYWRRADALRTTSPRRSPGSSNESVPFVLLALSTPSRRRSGLPSVARTFPQGRLLHKALASAVDRVDGASAAEILLGRDGARVAQTGHQHAHLLHLDLFGDGRLDHALIWAPAGISVVGLRAIRAVRRTWMKGGVGELQVALAATGPDSSLRPLDDVFGGKLSAVLGAAGGSSEWTSATPYLAPRLTKSRGKDSLVGQVHLELERRGFPRADVEVLPVQSELGLAFRHHVLHDREHRPPMAVTHALRLRFERPVEGPVCLGWGAHAGLGRFEVASHGTDTFAPP